MRRQEQQPTAERKRLILHADDLGLSHSKNRATLKAMEAGVVSSASIMMPCGWVMEVVEWAKKHPNADLGLHLTQRVEYPSLASCSAGG